MTPTSQGVMAAPNQCEIKAKVLHVEQSPKFSDKWHLEMEILETKDVSGPNFARARMGQRAKGFTFEAVTGISVGSLITAQAEFLGDQYGGQFQLTQIKAID